MEKVLDRSMLKTGAGLQILTVLWFCWFGGLTAFAYPQNGPSTTPAVEGSLQEIEDMADDVPQEALQKVDRLLLSVDRTRQPMDWFAIKSFQLYVSDLQFDTDNLTTLFKDVDELAPTLPLTRFTILYLCVKASALEHLGRKSEAETLFQEAVKQSESLKDPEGMATAYSFLGWFYQHNGESKKAIENFMLGFEISKKIAKKSYYIGFLNGIASVYTFSGEARQVEALAMFDEIHEYYSGRGNRRSMAISLINKSQVLRQLNRLSDAVAHMKRALLLAEAIHETGILAHIQLKLGDLYGEQNDFRNALIMLEKAEKTFAVGDNLMLVADTRLRRAALFNHSGQASMALKVLDEFDALVKGKDIGSRERTALEARIEAYALLGWSHQELILLRKAYKDISKEMDVKGREVINKLSAEFDLERKEAQNRLLQEQNKRQAIELLAAGRLKIGFIAISLLSVLLLLTLIFGARKAKQVRLHRARLRSLLEHIPQGILGIRSSGLVDANYSSHLPDILDVQSITNRSFKDLFLDHCEQSVDERDQTWNAILAIIGESRLGFEFNSSKLFTEYSYVLDGKQKFLKLTWNIETDENDNVKRLLVTMLDITPEVLAKKQLDKRNRDMTILQELVEIGPAKSLQFFGMAQPLLHENLQMIKNSSLSPDMMKVLFVNMHTVKGAARTLGLKALSEVMHRAESSYVRKEGHSSVQRECMLSDLQEIQTIMADYIRVNRDVLGHKEDYAAIPIARSFLEDLYHLLKSLTSGAPYSGKLQSSLQDSMDRLLGIVFVPLRTVFEDMRQPLAKMAKDLGKEIPRLEMETGNILLNHRQEVALKNSCVHILRNAMDHGIEAPDERRRRGKPADGVIRIRAHCEKGSIAIEISDDGRGLAIHSLKRKAEIQGLLEPGAGPEAIARTIFVQGVSTAASLTEISGRGVGMDAIQHFLKAEGGDIAVRLGQALDSNQEYFAFSFLLTLPHTAQEYSAY